MSSVAFEYGFFPDRVWNDPKNRELRELRGNANVLEPGDVVVIPDKSCRSEALQTGRTHVLRRRGVPERLRVRLAEEGEARGGIPYRLVVDSSAIREGKTDEDGYLVEWIAPDARKATLWIDGETFEIELGCLLPATNEAGVRARLVSLGYLEEGADDEAMHAALERFQAAHGLPVTATPDEATRAKLVEVFGS